MSLAPKWKRRGWSCVGRFAIVNTQIGSASQRACVFIDFWQRRKAFLGNLSLKMNLIGCAAGRILGVRVVKIPRKPRAAAATFFSMHLSRGRTQHSNNFPTRLRVQPARSANLFPESSRAFQFIMCLTHAERVHKNQVLIRGRWLINIQMRVEVSLDFYPFTRRDVVHIFFSWQTNTEKVNTNILICSWTAATRMPNQLGVWRGNCSASHLHYTHMHWYCSRLCGAVQIGSKALLFQEFVLRTASSLI